jgi:hypothetical protein
VRPSIYARCRVLDATAALRGTRYVVEGEPQILDEIARATRKERR